MKSGKNILKVMRRSWINEAAVLLANNLYYRKTWKLMKQSTTCHLWRVTIQLYTEIKIAKLGQS